MKEYKGPIGRLIVMVICASAAWLSAKGITFGLTESQMADVAIQVGSGIAAVGAMWWNHWKNNNYTAEAKEAQSVKDGMKEIGIEVLNACFYGGENKATTEGEHERCDPVDPVEEEGGEVNG